MLIRILTIKFLSKIFVYIEIKIFWYLFSFSPLPTKQVLEYTMHSFARKVTNIDL